MLNRIVIMGRLTRDPELRRTQSGIPAVSFSIACDRDFKDKANVSGPPTSSTSWPGGPLESL